MMKNQIRKTAALILALTLALSLLGACGASAKSSAADALGSASSSTAGHPAVNGVRQDFGASDDAAAAPEEAESGTGMAVWSPVREDDSGTQQRVDERKIIKTCELQLQTKEFDDTLDKILALVQQNGGYLDSQNVDGYSLYDNSKYYSRSAYLCARIPTDKLGSITDAIAGLCNLSAKSESRQDITDTYYDAEARLSTLRTQETRLLELLEKAAGLSDVIALESALSDVQYQIESMQGQLRRMDNQVAYSYLNMNLSEVVEYTETVNEPRTLGEKLAIAAGNAWRNVTGACEGILLFLVEYAAVILLWAALIALLVWLAFRLARALQKRRAARGEALPRRSKAAPAEPKPDSEAGVQK